MSLRQSNDSLTPSRKESLDMTKSTVWLCYDLGVRGDYDGLYRWLDEKKAKECGPNLAVFQVEYSSDLAKSIKDDLEKSIDINKRTRMYIIFRQKSGKKLNKGIFIFGGRRGSPWAGYAPSSEPDEDEEQV